MRPHLAHLHDRDDQPDEHADRVADEVGRRRDRGQHEAREVQLGGERPAVDDRRRGGRQRAAQVGPRRDADQHERDVGDGRLHLDDPGEHDGQDDPLHQREGDGPGQPEGGAAVAGGEVLPCQHGDQGAAADEVAQQRTDRGALAGELEDGGGLRARPAHLPVRLAARAAWCRARAARAGAATATHRSRRARPHRCAPGSHALPAGARRTRPAGARAASGVLARSWSGVRRGDRRVGRC